VAKHVDQTARLASATAVSREYGIKYCTLRDLVFRGQIPVVRLGRAWYFDRTDIDQFIDRSKVTR
jgi:excisionase family DNA binding protein